MNSGRTDASGKLMAKIKMPSILGWLIVGMLLGPHAIGLMPQLVQIVQGTIAAAAVINEFIAVIAAKKGFELAGEIQRPQKSRA